MVRRMWPNWKETSSCAFRKCSGSPKSLHSWDYCLILVTYINSRLNRRWELAAWWLWIAQVGGSLKGSWGWSCWVTCPAWRLLASSPYQTHGNHAVLSDHTVPPGWPLHSNPPPAGWLEGRVHPMAGSIFMLHHCSFVSYKVVVIAFQ